MLRLNLNSEIVTNQVCAIDCFKILLLPIFNKNIFILPIFIHFARSKNFIQRVSQS